MCTTSTDGTYDIQYDNGKHKKRISRHLIKDLETSTAASTSVRNGLNGTATTHGTCNGSFNGSSGFIGNGKYISFEYITVTILPEVRIFKKRLFIQNSIHI